MLLVIALFVINACFAATIPATPENITVTFLTPTTVRISWQTMIDLNAHPIEKYIVTYKSTDDSYRVVQDVAGNSEAVILDRLSPSTQYSIAVTAIWLGKKYRSRQIIFKTLDSAKIPSLVESSNGIRVPVDNIEKNMNDSTYSDDVTSTATNTLSNGAHKELPTIRGVEIGIVLVVLMVWAGAIALFFNRWGKIRMLLPYQPDYKHEQLKVPGTGMCKGGTCNGQHSHQLESSECVALTYQSLHCNKNARMLQNEHRSVSERRSRSRINSAIFVSSDEKGFDSIEFLRRHGSQSVLCRKAKSAENLRQNEAKMIAPNTLQCYTDECSKTNNGDNNNDCNELKITRLSSSMQNKDLPVPMLYSKDEANFSNFVTNRACANTTSHVLIGDISIETLPTSIESEPFSTDNSKSVQMLDRRYITKELPDTGKEFVEISTKTEPYDCTHPCSENLSMSNQSSSMHPHKRPQDLNLSNSRKQAALPMVSVSGPPPADAEELQRAESL